MHYAGDKCVSKHFTISDDSIGDSITLFDAIDVSISLMSGNRLGSITPQENALTCVPDFNQNVSV